MFDLAVLADKLQTGDLKDKKLSLAALRDVPSPDAIELIKLVLDDDNQQVRSMAIFALGIKQTSESFPLLVKILETDPDYGIRADAAGALGYLEDPRAFEPLIRSFYEDTDWLVRFSAAVSLGNLKDPRAHDALIQALNSPEIILQQAAIAAFGEIGDLSAVDDILAFAQSDDWLVRQRLAEALGNLPSSKSMSALRYLAKDNHSQVSEAAQISLQRLTDNLATAELDR
ncbi:MAG: HEAT repeat domain-containing protein [Cyanobacteria bacterium P01_D01_bin.156]